MRLKSFFLVVIMMCAMACGCAWIIIGSVGALGGYAVSQDTIQGEIDSDYHRLWNSSIRVINILGGVDKEDQLKGAIEGNVDSSHVKVTLERVTSKTVRLKTTARKWHKFLPNRNLASKLYVKIIEDAKK